MKIRALISIDLDARDFVDAADHQRRIEQLAQELFAAYPAAVLAFRERRMTRRGRPVEGAAASTATVNPQRFGGYVD